MQNEYDRMLHMVLRVGFASRLLLIALTPLSLNACAADPKLEPTPVNLSLHKPATSSSIENDEHNAAAANDGDPATCWISDDEPEGVPDWWAVDLQSPAELSGCEILFPYGDKNYRFRVEGSADQTSWSMLSDQTNTTDRAQNRTLRFENARGIRYVKITITGFDDGCWPSLCEVKIFGVVKRSERQP